MFRPLLACILLGLALGTPTPAQTVVTVTTLEDAVDVAGSARLGDLPGPDGVVSFREALLVTNNEPGPQTVEFAIPQEEWWLVDDYALLRLEDGVFLVTDDGTTLDFGSQVDFTGDTNPNGREVGVYGLQPNGWGAPAIIIDANDCVVRGLGPVLQRTPSVEIQGGMNNRVHDCVTQSVQLDPYPGTTSHNIIGGTAPGEPNVLGSVSILCGANHNLVIGNQLSSASVVGSKYCTAGNEYPLDNRIGGPTTAERNVLSGAGSYGSEGFPTGQNVRVEWARDTVVEGNYIGVTPDGLTRVPQIGPTGVYVVDSIDTTVRDNLVSGMKVTGVNHYAGEVFGRAVWIGALNQDNTGVVLEGNLIGTDATGENPITTYNGVLVAPGTGLRAIHDVRLGGSAPGAGNTVAFTELTGVAIQGDSSVELRGNSIHDNGLLGIDLSELFFGASGVTPNDPLDADEGANGVQNFPEIASAMHDGGELHVVGSLHSSPGDAFTLEFFGSPTCDPSGFGEGELPLGTLAVTTDAQGDASFDVVLAASLPEGWFVSATATHDALGHTSEFAACVAGVWHDQGHALPGLAGAPRFMGQGSLSEGDVNAVMLDGAAPGGLGVLFLALEPHVTPFKGGELLPLPSLLPAKLRNLGQDGAVTLPFTTPAGLPSGTELWLQWAVTDSGAPQGVALSNALMGRVP